MKLKHFLYILLSAFPITIYGQNTEWSDNEVLQYGFTLPIDWSFQLKNKEITSLSKLNKQMNKFFIPSGLYFDAYKTLTVISATKGSNNIFFVGYTIGGKEFKSYSIFKPTLNKEEKFTTATVLIPGSGENQSSEIYKGIGYHKNIANEIALLSDVFIAVKPNQDFLALHRNSWRLNYDFLVNYMLNSGGSYSASYIINTLATVKYLKTKYDRVFVIGLSQGGLAALLNSLQSSPDAAVISSGFTTTRELFEWAGHNQLIIPNFINKISNQSIHDKISKQNTNYLFSWGLNEIGTYKLEAENNYTSKFFQNLTNTEFVSHNQGHSFPQPFTNDFLAKIPFVSIDLRLTAKECDQQIYLKPVKLSSHRISAYKWFRNDTLLNVSTDSLLLHYGGKYKLVVATEEGNTFTSNKLVLSPKHFERKLRLTKRHIIAPEGFNSYKWYWNGKLLENEKENNIVIRQPGKYQCCLQSNLGTFSSNEIAINDNYAFLVKDLEVNIYPNPNNGQFKLELVSPERLFEKVNVIVYTQLGQIVYEKTLMPTNKIEEFILNITGLQKGIFVLKAITPTKTFVKSILVL